MVKAAEAARRMRLSGETQCLRCMGGTNVGSEPFESREAAVY